MRPVTTALVTVAIVVLTVTAVGAIAVVASPAALAALSSLGPVATGLVAIFALIVGISTIRQKQSADAEAAEGQRRDQWWKRAQWAIDRLFEEPEDRQVVAWRILRTLAESNLAGPEEQAIFTAVAGEGLTRLNPTEPDHQTRQSRVDTGHIEEGVAE